MRMLEAVETQMPQAGQEVLTPFDPSIGDISQASMAIPETSPDANIFDRATHLGHSALSYLRGRATLPGRLGYGLMVGLATASGYGLIADGAAAKNTHPINPNSTIIPIKSYYGTMLGQSAQSPFRVQHLELSAHRLVQSGPCVYNTTAIRPFPIDPIESTEATPKGETDTYCATKPGGHTTHRFWPRGKFISNPSMNFQPILEQIGEQAANSISLPPTSHGAPTRITINLNPKRHSGEADVFYGRSQPAAVGARQIKELKFRTHGHRETVRKLWY